MCAKTIRKSDTSETIPSPDWKSEWSARGKRTRREESGYCKGLGDMKIPMAGIGERKPEVRKNQGEERIQ